MPDNHAGVCLAFDTDRLIAAASQLAVARHLTLYSGPVSYRHRGGPADDPITLQRSRAEADLDGLVDEVFPEFIDDIYFPQGMGLEHRNRIPIPRVWRSR